jgi:filamentous hemagglutinin family protein
MVRNPSFRVRQSAILAFAINFAFTSTAFSLPQGPVIANGQVAINQPDPGVMNIKASNGAIINWKQFSIGAGEVTRFLQPSASSAVLNRVVGQNASQLLGQLQANGRVFLINPNGIVIGAGARIDTNGFIASTLDIADADFLAGKLKFFATGTAGNITNQGLISVGPGGRIALIAPNIENSGIIQAPGGKILLAAGRKIEITSMDFEGVSFEIQAPSDSVLNLGKLLADNGAVQVFAGTLRHSGEIRANRLVQDGDGTIRLVGSNEVTLTADSVTRADGVAGGTISIQSPLGTTRVAGTVSAHGSAGQGGDIRVLGQRVAIDSSGHLDASGATGGGQILVGGDFQGKNPDVQNAGRVFVGDGATLSANATDKGDGGRVIVWSDENTRYFGSLAVRGGPQGGNGGFAEVSGKQNLQFAGSADLAAPAGSTGFLLLDPLDIIVSATGGILPIVTDQFADFPTNILTISANGLNILGGNVILQANRNIYFNSATNFTGSSLTVAANGNTNTNGSVILNQTLSTSGGSLDLSGYTVTGSGAISRLGRSIFTSRQGWPTAAPSTPAQPL